MKKLNMLEVKKFVEQNIGDFHSARIQGLKKINLSGVLAKKNPYLFKAKNILSAQDLIEVVMHAHLSSQEETIFGTFLEKLAIFVSAKVFNGKKSSAEGIDLEFEKENITYLVNIKSGTNWGNSGQINKLKEDFRKAKRILGTNRSNKKIICVNGCCYGRVKSIDKGEYLKIAGQEFWEFISGNAELYTEIIEPLGHTAKIRNEEFIASYYQVLNQFTLQFAHEFCIAGVINWKKLVQYNSGKEKIKVSL